MKCPPPLFSANVHARFLLRELFLLLSLLLACLFEKVVGRTTTGRWMAFLSGRRIRRGEGLWTWLVALCWVVVWTSLDKFAPHLSWTFGGQSRRNSCLFFCCQNNYPWGWIKQISARIREKSWKSACENVKCYLYRLLFGSNLKLYAFPRGSAKGFHKFVGQCVK